MPWPIYTSCSLFDINAGVERQVTDHLPTSRSVIGLWFTSHDSVRASRMVTGHAGKPPNCNAAIPFGQTHLTQP